MVAGTRVAAAPTGPFAVEEEGGGVIIPPPSLPEPTPDGPGAEFRLLSECAT